MKLRRLFFLMCLVIFCLPQMVLAWDLEIGFRRLIPRIGPDYQEYTDKTGEKVNIKPMAETTATGFSYHMGLRLGNFQIDYDSAEFSYGSSIGADSDVVLVDTEINNTITENRLGLDYHIERELAGMFAGIGFSRVKEVLRSDDNTWTYETTTPFLKVGVDLILGAWILRYEQTFLSIGEHSVQVNSAGIILIF